MRKVTKKLINTKNLIDIFTVKDFPIYSSLASFPISIISSVDILCSSLQLPVIWYMNLNLELSVGFIEENTHLLQGCRRKAQEFTAFIRDCCHPEIMVRFC